MFERLFCQTSVQTPQRTHRVRFFLTARGRVRLEYTMLDAAGRMLETLFDALEDTLEDAADRLMLERAVPDWLYAQAFEDLSKQRERG